MAKIDGEMGKLVVRLSGLRPENRFPCRDE